MYLRIAPELYLKRLIVGGLDRVYEINRSFRNEGVSTRHNPELAKADLWDVEILKVACEERDIHVEKNWGAGKLLIELFETTVEPQLAGPVFITAYPTEVSPLSHRNDDNPLITDRFEPFVAGREIANGFSELNDPEDQAARFQEQAAQKDAGDVEAMHYDADYIRALEYGMPPTAGHRPGQSTFESDPGRYVTRSAAPTAHA